MSDLLYNEVPAIGDKYNFGDWKHYAVHNNQFIKGFFSKYRYLSNFYDARAWYDGELYPSSECAYQAAKLKPEFRESYITYTAAQSKKMIRVDITDRNKALYEPQDFDKIKYYIMRKIVFDKFYENRDIRAKLLETYPRFLEETNHWGDQFWGVDIKKGGANKLGMILMEVRDILRTFEIPKISQNNAIIDEFFKDNP